MQYLNNLPIAGILLILLEDLQIIVIVMQFIIALSILNVWVLRYDTIAAQFKEFELPTWVRNIVGIIKGTLCIMLIAGIWYYMLAVIASIGISILMFFAFLSHLRAKHEMSKSLPALGLSILCIVVAILCNHYKFHG